MTNQRDKAKLWRKNHPEETRLYHQRWYVKNKENHKAVVAAALRSRTEKFHLFKSTLKCKNCPESHPACLEFHHRNPAEKEFNITQAWRLGYSWKRILKEIEKCDVLCANCHRKLHWKDHPVACMRNFRNPESYRSPAPPSN